MGRLSADTNVLHGTNTRYTAGGCRCEACREAGKKFRRERDADPIRGERYAAQFRKYRQENKAYLSRLSSESRRRIRARKAALINHCKEETPCADCGRRYPYYVMDFDHRPGEKRKGITIAFLKSNGTVENVRNEMSRCEVVCSNCHRERTQRRKAAGAP